MEFGIKTDENNKVYCVSCNTHVGDNGKTQMNFCPKCGMHLKLKSAAVHEKRVAKEIITTLYELLDEIEDNERDPKEVIKEFIKELNNE